MRLLFFLWVPFLFAAPIGNPTLPYLLDEGFCLEDTTWTSPQCGFSFDYLFQKKLRPCHSSPAPLQKASLSGFSEVFEVTWNIKERFNLQVDAGSGQFSYSWIQRGHRVEGFARGGLVWGCDAKWAILNIRDTFLALSGQVGGWDWMDGSATIAGVPSTNSAHSLLRYWQIGGAVTQKIALFAPYLGFAINRTRMKVWDLPTGTGRMHARHVLGPFGGCSLSTGDRFLFNLEWRGWFEEGITLAGHIRF